MHIDDIGLILHAHPFSEGAYALTVFSENHGVVKGMVRVGRKGKASLEIGQEITFSHVRRLQSQLGQIQFDVSWSPLGQIVTDECRLAAVTYLCAMLKYGFKEEDPHPSLYHACSKFLQELPERNLWRRVAFFELYLLHEVGYGLHLSPEDAIRENAADDSPLMYVSPKSGRAVSAQAGEAYADKLCILPSVFGGVSDDFLDVFRLTGHFLREAFETKHLSARHGLIDLGIKKSFRD